MKTSQALLVQQSSRAGLALALAAFLAAGSIWCQSSLAEVSVKGSRQSLSAETNKQITSLISNGARASRQDRNSSIEAAAGAGQIVISQIYGGGGTAGATYRNSYVELFNRGNTAVDINNWVFQTAPASNSAFDRGVSFSLNNGTITIQPGQHFLIQLSPGGTNGASLPVTPDLNADLPFIPPVPLNTTGKFAVTMPNTGSLGASCLPNSNIVDLIGFGSSANCFEGGGAAGSLTATTAAFRGSNGCTDSDNNAADFSIGTPNPRNSTSPLTPCGGGTSNPIDQSDFFVRENYLDFLNRQADGSGLSYWTNEISACGLDQSCINDKRVTVSAAFFISIEFQQTGYLIERMYKTAFGDASGTSTFNGTHTLSTPIVRFTEFLPDTQQIGQGVVVGVGDWQTQLENNKQAFALAFVQRSRFTSGLASSLTPAQFVDKLNQNAGNVLSTAERNTAIALFNGAADSSNTTARAQALRQVAEDADLQTAEFNRAFVLMQYFGYLRRNPNDGPDSDYSGFDFWLSKLKQFNGNYVDAEMVKAFITSSEYRQRFGP